MTNEPIIENYTLQSDRGPYAEGGMSRLLHYTENSTTNTKENHNGAGSSVLVKTPLRLPLDPLEREFFENEILLAQKLREYPDYFTPYITSNKGVEFDSYILTQKDEEKRIPYIMWMLEEGKDLRLLLYHLIQKNKHLPLPYIAYMGSNLCTALERIHEKGYLHNDLKPGNIFIRKDGCPILLDLGISSEIKKPLLPTFLGTPDYSSPELSISNIELKNKEGEVIIPKSITPKEMPTKLREKFEGMKKEKILTEASDVYLLGMVLYELITQRNRIRDAPEAFRLKIDIDDDSKTRKEKREKINEIYLNLKLTGREKNYELILPLEKVYEQPINRPRPPKKLGIFKSTEKGLDELEEIIRSSLNPNPEKRPTVGEIGDILKKIADTTKNNDISKFFRPYMHSMPSYA